MDDGSTDSLTLEVLKQAEDQGCRVFHQANRGPAAARNKGISHAVGKYILFLDSDNKIRHDYISEGVAILNSHPDVGVVYGRPAFFGAPTRVEFITHAFDPFKILVENNVDMCAMIRKDVWVEVGGLDEERLLIGREDWEFWIRISGTDWKFFFVDKILFDYRIRENSLLAEVSQSLSYDEVVGYIRKKNYAQYAKLYGHIYKEYSAYKFDKENPVRSMFKFMFLKYFKTK